MFNSDSPYNSPYNLPPDTSTLTMEDLFEYEKLKRFLPNMPESTLRQGLITMENDLAPPSTITKEEVQAREYLLRNAPRELLEEIAPHIWVLHRNFTYILRDLQKIL